MREEYLADAVDVSRTPIREALHRLTAEGLANGGADDFLDRIGELNHEFHEIIMKTADNERLAGSVVRTIEFPIVHRTFQRYRPADLRRSLNHHREMIDAFEARDGEWASAVMRAHVLAAKHVILSTRATTNDELAESAMT